MKEKNRQRKIGVVGYRTHPLKSCIIAGGKKGGVRGEALGGILGFFSRTEATHKKEKTKQNKVRKRKKTLKRKKKQPKRKRAVDKEEGERAGKLKQGSLFRRLKKKTPVFQKVKKKRSGGGGTLLGGVHFIPGAIGLHTGCAEKGERAYRGKLREENRLNFRNWRMKGDQQLVIKTGGEIKRGRLSLNCELF